MKRVPRDVRQEADRYRLRIEADLHRLDSKFQMQFAACNPDDQIALLLRYAVDRFDRIAHWMSFQSASKNPGVIGPRYERTLELSKAKGIEFVLTVLKSAPEEVREPARRQIALLLESRHVGWLAWVKERHLARTAQHPRTPVRRITPSLIKRRKGIVGRYRRERDLTAVGFARHAGISETAIQGIVREDRSRFSEETQRHLLDVLGVSEEEWYGKTEGTG